ERPKRLWFDHGIAADGSGRIVVYSDDSLPARFAFTGLPNLLAAAREAPEGALQFSAPPPPGEAPRIEIVSSRSEASCGCRSVQLSIAGGHYVLLHMRLPRSRLVGWSLGELPGASTSGECTLS